MSDPPKPSLYRVSRASIRKGDFMLHVTKYLDIPFDSVVLRSTREYAGRNPASRLTSDDIRGTFLQFEPVGGNVAPCCLAFAMKVVKKKKVRRIVGACLSKSPKKRHRLLIKPTVKAEIP